jgi:hypothetical protein
MSSPIGAAEQFLGGLFIKSFNSLLIRFCDICFCGLEFIGQLKFQLK